MLHSSFSAVWITAVTIGRAFIASFAFVLRPPISAADSSAVGLSPYPYKILERTVTTMTKTEILKFRVTPEEKEIITHKALFSYRLVSQYLRDCVLGKQITVINGADNVADELRRIGNNVNQITRAVNAGFITEVNLTETREELKAIWQSLNSLLRTAR